MTSGYYATTLSAEQLRRCYEIAPPRVQQYLAAEIDFARSQILPSHRVLELGCGYGRVLLQLVSTAARLVGIDTSAPSLTLAREVLRDFSSCEVQLMNATDLSFKDHAFDVVLCLQNGLSAFQVDHYRILTEALRVTRPGGLLLFSSYAPQFWPHRLHWFELQAGEGLIGEIDHDATRNGVIVCKDGFTATTVTAEEFLQLASAASVPAEIREIDSSSIFCVISPR